MAGRMAGQWVAPISKWSADTREVTTKIGVNQKEVQGPWADAESQCLIILTANKHHSLGIVTQSVIPASGRWKFKVNLSYIAWEIVYQKKKNNPQTLGLER